MPSRDEIYGLPVRGLARSKYEVESDAYDERGRVVIKSFYEARRLAAQINAKRDLVTDPQNAVRASELNALALLLAVMRFVVGSYVEREVPQAPDEVVDSIAAELGGEALDELLCQFVEEFPPPAVARGEAEARTWASERTSELVFELMLLHLANQDPAARPLYELLDEAPLSSSDDYERLLTTLDGYFDEKPPFGPDNDSLLDMLGKPIEAAPNSLQGQLEYVRREWAYLLDDSLLDALLRGEDLIREESRPRFGGGPPATEVYEFGQIQGDPERFSEDRDWMPRCVLIAKNAFVWLEQLSRKHEREIRTLDAIPQEELEVLARRGVNGLWLIGLWERSPASQKIKRATGSADAVSSAYSLFDYRIADRLGGEDAYQTLREKAEHTGIRLAADMVTNHVGVDSKWVRENPDWFLSLDHSPFPSYSFNGPDLCDDPSVTVQIEDHYYDQTDAAVVFRHHDHDADQTRFIYHGNDGTSMPWNDTAQIDYLNPEAREAVIQTIVDVASRFPIIRFDAAMTLVKRHIRRLWYPGPGSGGAIASRAEYGISQEEFDRRIPHEFWAEVVDRIHSAVPDTLLLAEAFWMMEGYFVRSLGMHRVYNSAFMNMLRNEDNAGYRQVMKNTLEFDPQILKRYVNFMNNPDEDTAIDQFGDGDKYFGVCTMMATMPGLPMLGHGQIEGFREKYGMDFYRPLLDEEPNEGLVARHEHQIFPLLHRRKLFAEVDNFLLYDVFRPDGDVEENIFAYSNRRDGQRALVVYHNHFGPARGWIRMSVGQAETGDDGTDRVVQRSLGEGLNLTPDPDTLVTFRDHYTGKEFLRSSVELCERGFFVDLQAYDCHVFLDWREIRDRSDGIYRRLMERLDGEGVESIEEARRWLELETLHGAFRTAVLATIGTLSAADDGEIPIEFQRILPFVNEAANQTGREMAETEVEDAYRARVNALRSLRQGPSAEDLGLPETVEFPAREARDFWEPMAAWCVVDLPGLGAEDDAVGRVRSWFQEWRLGEVVDGVLGAVDRGELTLRVLLGVRQWKPAENNASELVEAWLRDPDVRDFIGVNRADDVLWFHREFFERFLNLWLATGVVDAIAADDTSQVQDYVSAMKKLWNAAESSEYRVERLREHIGEEA